MGEIRHEVLIHATVSGGKALIVMGNMFVNLFVRLACLFYCNRKFSNRS